MWSPTHVQLLVKRGKGLKVKGKNGTNDAFITMGLGKEKFQTSVVEKTTDSVEWMEQCELKIPTKGNTAEVVLTALHRNFLGVDEFLGRLCLPLNEFDHNDKPSSKWYPLTCKAGQSKSDYRGEIEVRVGFVVNAQENIGGSAVDLTKKKKGSNSSISKISGSLINLGSKPTNLKKLAGSVGHKIDKVGGKAKKSLSSLKLNRRGLESLPEDKPWGSTELAGGNLDPGVNSDEEDTDVFKKISSRSSSISRNSSDSLSRKNSADKIIPPQKPQRDRQNLTGNKTSTKDNKSDVEEDNLPLEVLNKFNGKTREDLIKEVVNLQTHTEVQGKKIKDLEEYIDEMLTKVIEEAPTILQKERLRQSIRGIRSSNKRFNSKVKFQKDWTSSKFG